MSHPIYRALVTYSNTSTGEIRIKIPSLIGLDSEVSISYIGRAIKGTTWSVPDIGAQIVVTADDANLTNIFWLQVDETASNGVYGDVFVGSTNTFSTNQIIQGTTTAALLRVTQLGTGDALRVEDETNPDSTPFVITAIGDVQIGTANDLGKVNIGGTLALHAATPLLNFVNVANSRMGYLYHDATNMILLNQTAGYVSFGTNNIERMRIDSAGRVGIGISPISGRSLTVAAPLVTSVPIGIFSAGEIQSDATSSSHYYKTLASTATASFTSGFLYHYLADQGPFGVGSTVTNQYGFAAGASMIGATNNYGFQGYIPSGTGRWNLYMGGTAANYMAGRLGIGTPLTTGAMAQVANTTLGDDVLILKGATGQTGDFLDIQNSAGTPVFTVDNTGTTKTVYGILELGFARTTDGYAYIDLIGDTTYSDYGLRLLRGNTGANTISQLLHRGTGAFSITAQDAAPLLFSTTNTERMRIDSTGQVGIASPPTANVRLTVTGGSTNSANPAILINGVSGSGSLFLFNDMGAGAYNNIVSAGSKGVIATGANSTTTRASFVIAPWSDLTYGIRFEGGATTNILQHGTVILSPSAAANKALIVKGVASQTANLQEWQDSASAVKAFVSPTGAAQFVSINGGTA